MSTRVKYLLGSYQGSQVGSLVGSQMGSLGGILERDPKWDPRWDREDPRWDFNSPNIFYICLVHSGIPSGIRIPAGMPSGIPKQALARISKVGSKVKSRVVFASYELLSQICNSVLCERPGT